MSHQAHSERARDKALEESFPASDPPASSGITGAGSADKSSDPRIRQDEPTGTPTSDRHSAETAHQRENESEP